MILEGSVINFLGDSITQGVGANCIENRYTDVLARQFGLKRANNYGISGTRIARQRVVTDDPFDQDFCMRMDGMDTSADAVVVFGGTNDFGHGDAPLGTPADRDPSTFWRAPFPDERPAGALLRKARGHPHAAASPERGQSPGRRQQTLRRGAAERLSQNSHGGRRALRAAGAGSLRRQRNPAGQRRVPRAAAPDGLHPSDEGHALIAGKIGRFLQTL